jgi:hypothetical protein
MKNNNITYCDFCNIEINDISIINIEFENNNNDYTDIELCSVCEKELRKYIESKINDIRHFKNQRRQYNNNYNRI